MSAIVIPMQAAVEKKSISVTKAIAERKSISVTKAMLWHQAKETLRAISAVSGLQTSEHAPGRFDPFAHGDLEVRDYIEAFIKDFEAEGLHR
jgi:hypothetical protein